jgi:hypothetical protein
MRIITLTLTHTRPAAEGLKKSLASPTHAIDGVAFTLDAAKAPDPSLAPPMKKEKVAVPQVSFSLSALVCSCLLLSALVCSCLLLSALFCSCLLFSALVCSCLLLSALFVFAAFISFCLL